MTDNEQYYDEEIAPLLAKVGELCKENGLSIVCAVEFDHNDIGTTVVLQPDKGLNILMNYLCVKTAPNVDAYIIALKRYCQDNDIDMGASIYLTK